MPTALVLSVDFKKAYPVLKSLRKLGFRIVAVFRNWRSYCFSRYVDERVRVQVLDEKTLLDLVRKTRPDVVVPVSFQDYVVVSRLTRFLSVYTASPLGLASDVEQAADKYFLHSICRTLQLRYPRTILVDIRGHEDVKTACKLVEENLTFPVVVKGRSDASRPVYVPYPEDLHDVLSRIRGEVLVQEYVPGTGCGYFAVAVEGEPLVEYTHVRVVEEKASGGPSVRACLDFDPELIQIGRRILKHLRWTGPIMIEMKRHIETGELYIIEINPKLWGSLELAVALGVDIPCELTRLCIDGVRCRHEVRRGCFTWLLASMHYLRDNPSVWLRLLWTTIREGILRSDVHLADPAELLYGLTTRLISVISGWSRSDWKQKYWQNFLKLVRKLRRVRVVALDLDGTLVNLKVPWHKVRKRLKELGLIRGGESIAAAYYRAWRLGVAEKVSKVIEEFELPACSRAKISKSIAKLLYSISRVYRLCLVTKQSREAALRVLRNSGLESLFEVVLTREDAPTKRDQLRMLVERLNTEPSSILMIGDSVIDMYAALSNKMLFLAVARNMYHAQMFTEFGVATCLNIKDALKLLARV